MLTLARKRTLAGYDVYEDADDDLAADPKKIVAFYVLPKAASLARDEDGKPRASVVLYRRPLEAGTVDVGGAIVTLTVDLTVPDADLAAVRDALRAAFEGADGATAVAALRPAPFASGRVDLEVQMFRLPVGGETTPAGQRALVFTLDADGAALFRSSKALPSIGVRHTMTLEHALVGGTLVATCDAEATVSALHQAAAWQRVSGVPGLDVALAVASLLELGAVTLSTTSVGASADELDALAREELTARVAGVVASPSLDGGSVDDLRALVASSLAFRLEPGATLHRTIDLRTDLAQLTASVDWAAATIEVDLTPPILRVQALAVFDFARAGIDAVKITIEHRGARTATGEMLLRDQTSRGRFACWVDPNDSRSYTWSAVTTYKGSAVTFATSGTSDHPTLVLSATGVIDVDVTLGVIDFKKLRGARVDLRYASKALESPVETTMTLDAARPSSGWIAPIGEEYAGTFDFRATWTTADGTRIARPWATSTDRALVLASPFVGALTVDLDVQGDFASDDGIAQIITALRYVDASNDYRVETTLVSTAPGKQTVSFDLVDATVRGYETRSTIVRKSGVTRNVPEDGWQAQTASSLLVGEVDDLHFTVDPSGLAFGAGLSLVQVDVACDPAPGVHATKSFLFTPDDAKPKTWTGSTGAPPGPRSYRVTVTYFGADGPRKGTPVVVDAATFAVPVP